MKTSFGIIIASGLLAGTAALAQTAQPGTAAPQTRDSMAEQTDRLFARLDQNADGRLDSADRAERRARLFDRLDSNSDGLISRNEWAAAGERRHEAGERLGRNGRGDKRAGRMPRNADADGDRAISQAEFRAAALARFERLDADRDGTVTPAERAAARPSR